MMSLYLMRHGDAEPPQGRPDQQRALTSRGIADVRKQGRDLAKLATEITHIYHSPYQRAQQTAELVNESLAFLPILSSSHLVPSGDAEKVLDLVMAREEHILLVCHLPIIADIAYALCTQELHFFPGTIARFLRADGTARSGTFDWLRHP